MIYVILRWFGLINGFPFHSSAGFSSYLTSSYLESPSSFLATFSDLLKPWPSSFLSDFLFQSFLFLLKVLKFLFLLNCFLSFLGASLLSLNTSYSISFSLIPSVLIMSFFSYSTFSLSEQSFTQTDILSVWCFRLRAKPATIPSASYSPIIANSISSQYFEVCVFSVLILKRAPSTSAGSSHSGLISF